MVGNIDNEKRDTSSASRVPTIYSKKMTRYKPPASHNTIYENHKKAKLQNDGTTSEPEMVE